MGLSVVVTNYGIGDNSVLVVNRAILDGMIFNGLLARSGNLTYQGDSKKRMAYTGLPEYQAFVEKHGAPDVLIGQASFAKKVFLWAKEHTPGTVRILQRDSTHMRTWKDLVGAEYKRVGLDHEISESLVKHEEHEYELADAITVLSRWVERSFIDRGLGDKTYYASPQTIMLNRWKPMPRKKDGIRFRVMVAGQFRVAKGTHRILKAWREVKPDADQQLVFSGVYPDLPQDERQFLEAEYEETRRTANTRIIGWTPVEHMSNRFAECDCYCLPSIQEGSSMTCVEALTCGRALIASDRCGSDILEENDDCGQLVSLDDEQHLRDALERYMRSPNLVKLHGERGRELALEYGGMERFGRDYATTVKRIWHDLRS